jgi:hypothetical protein
VFERAKSPLYVTWQIARRTKLELRKLAIREQAAGLRWKLQINEQER